MPLLERFSDINNFGIPTLYAVSRAERHLRKKGVRDKVSLVISGGVRDSGDVLKAIALGADAVYIGYAALFALVYSQIEDLDPGTSPTEMELYDGKQSLRGVRRDDLVALDREIAEITGVRLAY